MSALDTMTDVELEAEVARLNGERDALASKLIALGVEKTRRTVAKKLGAPKVRDEFRGYDVVTLRAVFDLVANTSDWKGPIDCEISTADFAKRFGTKHLPNCNEEGAVALTFAAIEFFTATAASADFVRVSPAGDDMVFRITAKGYRAGPAW